MVASITCHVHHVRPTCSASSIRKRGLLRCLVAIDFLEQTFGLWRLMGRSAVAGSHASVRHRWLGGIRKLNGSQRLYSETGTVVGFLNPTVSEYSEIVSEYDFVLVSPVVCPVKGGEVMGPEPSK